MILTWPSHDPHMTLTRPSHDHHITLTWPSHDHHMIITVRQNTLLILQDDCLFIPWLSWPDGAALFYASTKEDKNVSLLHKYLLHRAYNLPFKESAWVVDKDAVFMWVSYNQRQPPGSTVVCSCVLGLGTNGMQCHDVMGCLVRLAGWNSPLLYMGM